MSDTRLHINLKQAPVETEGAIELSEINVSFSHEPPTPKILVEFVAHYPFLVAGELCRNCAVAAND